MGLMDRLGDKDDSTTTYKYSPVESPFNLTTTFIDRDYYDPFLNLFIQITLPSTKPRPASTAEQLIRPP